MEKLDEIGTGIFSPKYIALGLLTNPTKGAHDGLNRCLYDGEEISLELDHKVGDDDAEFIVNKDPSRRILYSQLSCYFMRAVGHSLYSGCCYVNGLRYLFVSMGVDSFISLIIDRRFMVSVDCTMFAIKTSPKGGRCFSTMSQLRDFICDSLTHGRYKDIEGVTRLEQCYSLSEII